MFIKDTSSLDLETIDNCIEIGNKLIQRVPSLTISEDAKREWVHEITASNGRMSEMRPGYLDGRTTIRHEKDRCLMLMHVTLVQQFMGLLKEAKLI